ncbi:hypothetical protein QJS10_CPA06g00810 [Acorus calamus]|uniref:Uncharacterized protein n=1 Tax=Acorus calamus TaxID=4465 RepID=A0AAV9EKU8_ACOCL|nr:hypothetical protein QJS10_CPA06g00810 [Acorus calamus]
MEQTPPVSAKRLWRIVRTVFYMIRRGLVAKKKWMADLHVLLKRGKIAGKSLFEVPVLRGSAYSALTCRSADPHVSFYDPREVEFSCSNTPFYARYSKNRRRHHSRQYEYETSEYNDDDVFSEYEFPEASQAPFWNVGKSPACRQLRITDSPFPIKEDEEDCHVDDEAEDFIRRFYEQLSMQQVGHRRRNNYG